MPRTTRSLYSVHPSVDYARAILDNLPAKTGRSLDEWLKLIQADGPSDSKARRDWLKTAHQVGGTTAALIVSRAEGRSSEDTDPGAYLSAAPGYVEQMYAGPKSALRPIHDALVEGALRLHQDVRICPCQTIVPLYRHHVIAQIKPSTNKRLDFGLALKGATRKLPQRLLDTGGLAKGDRITHRIGLSDVSDVDAGLWKWFELAYELDG